MNRTLLSNLILFAGALACSGCAALSPPAPAPAAGAAAAPAAPTPNICDFLGVTALAEKGKACGEKLCICMQRQFPGAAGPPELGEVGPESSPAVACAAEIIAEEALAPVKIDAIRYLGRVGCSKCYTCVEEGLLAALDDCTEEVRYEAAKALRQASTDKCNCCQSSSNSCCTKKVLDKLRKVAYETNDAGNPYEPSPRVRRVARQILSKCGSPIPEEGPEPTPAEGPSGDETAPPAPPTPPEEGPKADTPPAPPAASSKASDTTLAITRAAAKAQAEANSATPATTTDNQPKEVRVALKDLSQEISDEATVAERPAPRDWRPTEISAASEFDDRTLLLNAPEVQRPTPQVSGREAKTPTAGNKAFWISAP